MKLDSNSLLRQEAKLDYDIDDALSKVSLDKLLEYSYLNLQPNDFLEINNELIDRDPRKRYENPIFELMDFMKKPENFAFTCKWLLGVNLLPMQVVILNELWKRKYPMFIGVRGAGKCITGNTKIMLQDGIYNISDIIDNNTNIKTKQYIDNKAFGENGFQNIEYGWNNGITNNIRLKTRTGFELEGTKNHPIRVVDNGKIFWKDMRDIKIGDYIPIDRTESWFEKTNNLTEDEAYLFGLLVGDGGYTKRGSISFTNIDEELVNEFYRLSEKIFDYIPHQDKCKITYHVYGVKRWDDLFQKYGFNSSVCVEKDVPQCIFHAKKNVVAKFISGLFDTDGGVERNGIISCTSKSKNLIKNIQFLLTRFGIIGRFRVKYNKRYNRYYYSIQMTGDNARLFAEKIGFGLSRKQRLLDKLLQLKSNPNLDIIPHDLVLNDLLKYVKIYKDNYIVGKKGYNYNRKLISESRIKLYQLSYTTFYKILTIAKCEENEYLYDKLIDIYNKHYYYDKVTSLEEHKDVTYDIHIPSDHSFITNGIISHNSWLLALYSVLLLLFRPGSKIIFVGAGFRQSKILSEYVESLYRNSPIFQNIIGNNRSQGPKHDTDRHSFYAGDSVIHALPIGDGQKIRGMRATNVISDEFHSMILEVFEVVIEGFASVNINPVEKVKKVSDRKILKKLGMGVGELEEVFGNQTIISGTAFYAFNHFYDYWNRYKGIVQSRGDKHKLEEIFRGEVPEKFDWRDYSIIRLPWEAVPEGMMDETHIAKAKAIMHSSRYIMEYGACIGPDTDIITDNGIKNILDIEVGEKVLTHKGRFRPVVKKTFRKYNDNIIKLKCYGYNQDIYITPNHKCLYNNEWKDILDIEDKVYLSSIQEKIFYNADINISNKKEDFICYDNNIFTYKIKSKEYIPYNGYVYNLEVEDDNSYSLPCMTVHNCFVTDSDGFFKRSLIESCVTPVQTVTEKISFKSSITGKSGYKYVYGIDPASEDDNFTIVILELHDSHRRIVYGWSATKQKLRERLKKVGQTTSGTSYYSYCARKIRDLMKYFPTDHIAIDKQGGGIPLIEAFHHIPDMEAGECALWPYRVEGKDDPFWWEKTDKVTDNEAGLHIIHEIQFGDAKFTEEANHNLRKDLETKTLLFPMFDAAEIGLSMENDIAEGREYDTLEDCVLEIEELKNELSTITHSRTPTGRDKWSTPEIKEVGGRIGRMRKDRYSALVMANQVARTIGNTIGKIDHTSYGGYVSNIKKDNKDGPMYYGSYKADKLKYMGCAVTKEN